MVSIRLVEQNRTIYFAYLVNVQRISKLKSCNYIFTFLIKANIFRLGRLSSENCTCWWFPSLHNDKICFVNSVFLQNCSQVISGLGAIQVLRNADGGGGVRIPRRKRYEGARFNVI